ncbi:MAG: flavodoxin-dependent (E)-4-hydroxy-3-methylbut-2-enyl-diphosphate synthase [Candidatus Zhuqueibacterota bacterium]
MRHLTRKITVGDRAIGGDSPISIQSMTKTKTSNIEATVNQILELEIAGCDIIRVAVPDEPAAEALPAIRRRIHIPLVADIHFSHKLAIMAIDAGVDKIRINPGNIGDAEKVRQVLEKASEKQVAVRIGVNAGSIEKDVARNYGGATAEAMVESALRHVRLCEQYGFSNIVISMKASDVTTMIQAYQIIAEKIDYPLHLGVTEAGTPRLGLIKSAIGIGALLSQGIGDSIRVSLTADPLKEIEAGQDILQALNMSQDKVTIISCPTCGRLDVNLFKIVNEVEEKVRTIKKNLKVAIMGCVVNGPGEAREADIGVACGNKKGVLFKKGKVLRTVAEELIADELYDEICKM